jgi:C1A family cysteine protease
VAFALDFERQKQNESLITPSRLFIYYNEREAQGTIMSDSGSSIRQSVREVLHQGACPESEWAYDLTKWNVKPDQKCYTDGVQFEAIQYQRVNRSLNDLQIALAAGNPVLIGFTVYSSFETPGVAKTGQMTMPGAGESVLGGHAVSVVGYDRTKKVWICRNSWGTGWGDQGYFYMPFDYLLNSSLSSDFWVLRSVK